MNHRILSQFAGLCVALCFTPSLSADDAVDTRLDTLERAILEQEQALERQREELRRLRESVEADNADQSQEVTAETPAPAGDTGTDGAPARTTVEVIESTHLESARAAGPEPVGQAPEAKREAPSSLLSLPEDVPGVLSAQGKITLEPQFQFSNSQLNRFTFRGVEIIDTFLLGIIEAEDSDRDLYTLSLTGRYGLTNRIELELKVPYIWRDDELSAIIPQIMADDVNIDRSLEGDGIGDIEFAVHYQINEGKNGWPFFVGNLRYKSTTGEGPFDVSRDADGIEKELATGSGFHAIEPSLTILYPTDPAVLFANIGYLFNLEDDVDEQFGESLIGEVDPGDSLRLSFGMAYAVNEKLSFTVGYKHDFIDETETEIVGSGGSSTFTSADLSVGSLLLGYGYQLNNKVGINVNVEVGATDDAPDTTVTLRVPFSI